MSPVPSVSYLVRVSLMACILVGSWLSFLIISAMAVNAASN